MDWTTELFQTATPAGLGPEPREGVWTLEQAGQRVTEACRASGLGGGRASCLRALVLLWHDHLEAAHGLVQDVAGADAAFVHGIMHRREPDYSNARYWFHRVGNHPAFEALADEVAPVLGAHTALSFRLLHDGRWDPMAFIEAVAWGARRPAASSEAALLGEVQRMESLVLARQLAGI